MLVKRVSRNKPLTDKLTHMKMDKTVYKELVLVAAILSHHLLPVHTPAILLLHFLSLKWPILKSPDSCIGRMRTRCFQLICIEPYQLEPILNIVLRIHMPVRFQLPAVRYSITSLTYFFTGNHQHKTIPGTNSYRKTEQ